MVLDGGAFGLCTARPTKMRGVVVHMHGHKGFTDQARDPVTDLIVMRCDHPTLITVKGMANGEGGVAAVT